MHRIGPEKLELLMSVKLPAVYYGNLLLLSVCGVKKRGDRLTDRERKGGRKGGMGEEIGGRRGGMEGLAETEI